MTPESKYPAADEDIDTIISGTDGKDYIVDIIDGIRQWVLYLPEVNDVIIIEKSLPPIEFIKKEITAPEKTPEKKLTDYHHFMSEMTIKLKKEYPNMKAPERRTKISEMWAKEKFLR
jgi:hypothetical protein